MSALTDAQSFASSFSSQQSSGGSAGFSPFNIPPSQIQNIIPDALQKAPNAIAANGGTTSSFFDAIKNAASSAVKAVTPGSSGTASAGINGMSKAAGDAVSNVGNATGKLIMDAADGIQNAGQGIQSGTKWATIVIFVIAALYVMSWLPRRS